MKRPSDSVNGSASDDYSGPKSPLRVMQIVELLAAGRIRPVVDERTFPLDQTADAIDYLSTGVAQGRVVLTV